jgi:hypothetical protein
MSKSFHKIFKFLDWHLDESKHQLQLNYRVEAIGRVTECLEFPPFTVAKENQAAISRACELIHLLCGVSYYKAGLAENIEFESDRPPKSMIDFVAKTWFHGLAEMAFENEVSLNINFNDIDLRDNCKILENRALDTHKSLVPLGGGKDSLVTIEELKQQKKNITLFMVGQSELIKDVAQKINLPLLQVKREIDSQLIAYNKTKKGFNGHVPITAINSSIAVLVALLFDFSEIVFSNERSSDSANTINKDGDLVNHQYSKSYEFERDLASIITQQISPNLNYYSQQRAYSELAILEKFSHYPQYFSLFSSCNRNFHIDGSKNVNSRWCCDCPKCRFVFLGLAPFVEKKQLLEIFKVNLLDDEKQKQGFAELLGTEGFKPFECVGEIEESQLAFNMIKNRIEWTNDCLIQKFNDECPKTSLEQQHNIMLPTP